VVDLVKAAGAQRIGLAAEGIQNESLAIQYLFHIAQHYTGLAGVHILYDGGNGHALFFCLSQQSLDKVFCAGQHGLRRYQHYHHLPGHDAPAQQAVAYKASALIFVKGLVMAGVRRHTHCQHGFIQHFVLQKAAFHRQRLMAVCRVDAGGEFSTPAGGKGGDHLIAVVVRLLCAPDGVHRAVFAQQPAHILFFFLQLVCVLHAQHGAAAAVSCSQFAIHSFLSFYP